MDDNTRQKSSPPESTGRQETAREAFAADQLQEPQRLHPMTLILRLLISLPALVYLLLPVFRSPDSGAWFSLVAAVLYGVVTIPILLIQYNVFRYWITSDEVVIVSGIFSRKKRSIPLDRIHNIAIEQRLLARMTGTAKVKIESGGGSDTEGELEYVSLAQARKIQQTVKRRQAAAPVETSEEQGEDTPDEQLHHMAPGRVLLAGTFQFSLVYIAVMFGVLEFTGLQPEEAFEWIVSDHIADIATASPVVTIAATLVTAVLLAWLSGILLTFNRYYRFDLTLSDEKLHRKMGLLTLSERTIPLNKIQLLITRTNPLMRRYGWFRLEAQTLGIGTNQQGPQVVMPFAGRRDVGKVAERLHPLQFPAEWRRVSPLTIRRHFLRYVFLLAVVTGICRIFWAEALWLLLLTPGLLVWAWAQYRKHLFATSGRVLYVRRGVIRQRCWMIPCERFQALDEAASFFQRRLGLRSLVADTAGAPSFPTAAIIDLPAGEADDLLRDLSWRHPDGTFTNSRSTHIINGSDIS